MKILLSAPRAGSSYAYEMFHQHNLTLPNVRYIGVEEYLDPNQLSHLTLEEKINFLNKEKEKGISYTFKHHINYLGDYYESWFKEFYANDEIFVLKRRDVWKWFLSFLFQDYTGWNLAHFDKNKKIEIEKYWREYGYQNTLKQFFDIKNQLDCCSGQIIFYEDLTHTAIKNRKLSDHIQYEKYFPNINIIRKEFCQWQ